jgi:predicted glycosyltransferase
MTRIDPRLDLVIYAHDGRGLGHASRGIAVGSAVRRLFPELKVLFVSGCRYTAALIGPAPLDWIKLPSYKTIIVNGLPRGHIGNTNLKNAYLSKSRSRLIQTILAEYRPRCLLVDHEAPGKKAELLPALETGTDTVWALGLRGIIGKVEAVWSDTAVNVFNKYYQDLLWYGDAAVLGRETLQTIENRYGLEPFPTGYISRFRELAHWLEPSVYRDKPFAGTIAVSWYSQASLSVLKCLHQALTKIGDAYGIWQVYVNFGHALFEDLPFCRVQNLSPHYLYALAHSKTAAVYGGYNSMTDILSVNVPAVIFLRNVEDQEQALHVKKLAALPNTAIVVMPEETVTADRLQQVLEQQLQSDQPRDHGINLDGAENTAKKLVEFINAG